jgi:hypothetical protein
MFEPKADREVPAGTVTRAKATCVCCGGVLSPERVRAQLAAQRGGADVIFDGYGRRIGGARMLAAVTLRSGEVGRQYRLSTERDYESVRRAQVRVAEMLDEWKRGGKKGLCPVPDEPLPPVGTLGFRVQRYGMLQWGDLFTARQKMALGVLATLTSIQGKETPGISLALGKLVDLANTVCRWEPVAECPRNVFAAGRVKMGWDFAEGCAIADSSGGFSVCVDNLIGGVASVGTLPIGSTPQIAAAQNPLLPHGSAHVWFTDPPYDDQVPYADLSDVFFVWHKRALPFLSILSDPFDPLNSLTPKSAEAVRDEAKTAEGRPKDRSFFESAMAASFLQGERATQQEGIGCVIFAHKTTEGWESLLSGMTRGGWVITSSWPVATETPHRLRARESAALATSVHLICRPRPDDALIGDWADVLRELPRRVGDWMERLQREGVRGADLVFACIGPALEIFSRYAKVETAEGREVGLAEFLEKVWEVVGRGALTQVLGAAEGSARNGAATALEEDARLAALFLWTLQSTNGGAGEGTGNYDEELAQEEEEEEEDEETSRRKAKGFTLVFDVVRRFAQPLGIDLPKWESRVIETKKGVVRLLPVAERAKQLFGEEGAHAVASRLEQPASLGLNPLQGLLFPELEAAPKARGRSSRGRVTPFGGASDQSFAAAAQEATTLDRVHAAMLLQASGRTNALRALLKAEQDRGPDFLRLGNALSALYPKGSEEKRLLDAMLLAAPR